MGRTEMGHAKTNSRAEEMRTDVCHRPVGSGKTALMLQLCLKLRDEYSIAAVTNDIFTRYASPSLLTIVPTPITCFSIAKTPNS